MRDWLIIIGGLVAFGILLDCIRRMRKAGHDKLHMDLPAQTGTREPVSGHSSPASTGKVEPRMSGTTSFEDTLKTRRTPTLNSGGAADKLPRSPVDLEQAVPLLMDDDHQETTFDDDRDLIIGSVLSPPRVVPRRSTADQAGTVEEREVIVINVMSQQPENFKNLSDDEKARAAAALLENVLASGMRYGSMSIFHYYGETQDENTLFSMANMVKPGTFDLDNMKSFQTPGVSFFMALPLKDSTGKVSAMEAFDKMLAIARRLAQNLQGEMRDEQRSVMTGQTIEHCRQRISEFSRKKLSRSGKYTSDH
jgi:cell division protein ZipA